MILKKLSVCFSVEHVHFLKPLVAMSTLSPTARLFCSGPYVTFNPQMFDSIDTWTLLDLRHLCTKLRLNTKGKRSVLVKRLLAWHRNSENDQLEQNGQNFTLLGVKVEEEEVHSDSTPPMTNRSEFLSPLKVKNKLDHYGTPSSILRRNSAYSANSTKSSRRRKSLAFSPFNGVQLIPARKRIRYETLEEEDDEEYIPEEE